MSCNNDQNNNPTFYSFQNNSNNGNCGNDASNIIYTGANLTSIDSDSGLNLQQILQNVNTTIGTIEGIDWSSFDYSCLGDLTTAQEFVETISEYVCDLSDDVNTFIGTTYAAGIAGLQANINTITNPEFESCSEIEIVTSDTYEQVINKIITSVCSIIEIINPSTANWNQCFIVSPNPTNITDAFNVVLAQICNLKNNPSEVDLPTFNNLNSCLSIQGTVDTLYNTVVAIRDLLCTLPSFDIDNLAWTSCITNPNSGGGADLISSLNTIIAKLNSAYTNRVVTFDPNIFNVTYSTPNNACSGKVVTLQDGVGLSDKLVALDGDDDNPNYLLSKIVEGNNIEFDTDTNSGQVIINSTAEDIKVKADSGGTSSGYLIDKVEGKSDITSAIEIVESYNISTDKVDFTPLITYSTLSSTILNTIAGNENLLAQLCSIMCECSPCTTTTTSTTSRVISALITNENDDSTTFDFNFTMSQNNSSILWFNSGNIDDFDNTLPIATGYYAITSSDIPVTGIITLTNKGGATITYNIYVRDGANNSISDASTITGSIVASATLDASPFTYGTSPDGIYKVHIEIDLAT